MGSLMADELDKRANRETILGVARKTKARMEKIAEARGDGKVTGGNLYEEIKRQLAHWRPDIPEAQIRTVLLGGSLGSE